MVQDTLIPAQRPNITHILNVVLLKNVTRKYYFNINIILYYAHNVTDKGRRKEGRKEGRKEEKGGREGGRDEGEREEGKEGEREGGRKGGRGEGGRVNRCEQEEREIYQKRKMVGKGYHWKTKDRKQQVHSRKRKRRQTNGVQEEEKNKTKGNRKM